MKSEKNSAKADANIKSHGAAAPKSPERFRYCLEIEVYSNSVPRYYLFSLSISKPVNSQLNHTKPYLRKQSWCVSANHEPFHEIPHLPPAKHNTDILTQAHRIITQVFVTGARVFGRAATEAWKHASAQSAYQRSVGGNPAAANTLTSSGLTLDEACRILNVSPPKGGQANLEQTTERFKKLFDLNDPKKGGSFYLQSKILRARERIELEVREAEMAAERKQEVEEGWKPKVYKDR